MSRSSTSKSQDNNLSILLSPQENQALLELLGRRCLTLATAVVQLWMALPHSPTQWSFQHVGVACFIKDNPQRSYFIRIFNIKEGKQIWEQELYSQMIYHSPQDHFHTFSADECQVGLNFASETEAETFRVTVMEKISSRADHQEKKPPSNGNRGPPPPLPPNKSPDPGNGMHSGSMVDIPNPDILASRYRSPGVPTPAPASLNFSKSKNKKGKKGPRLTKADIGAPSDFKHVTHVGWDPNTGFDTANLDPALKELFYCAGISEDQLTDAETSKLIYDFIEQSGGLEAVKEEMQKQDAPRTTRGNPGPPRPPHPPSAPPSRGRSHPPPPPPPSGSRGAPPPPPPPPPGAPHAPRPPGHSGPPRPPTSPVSGSGGPLPPPPPPPPPPPSTSKPKLGVDSGAAPAPVVSRGGLLDQIRLGTKLKNVTENADATPQTESSEGIVNALMLVMQKRSKVIHSSGDEEDDAVDEEDDEEWD